MVINFVLMHNQQYDKNYHITKDMLNNKVQPVPAELGSMVLANMEVQDLLKTGRSIFLIL